MPFDWKKVVRGAAPALAAALGGPAAGAAIAAVSRAVLGHDNGTQDEIAAALAMGDPAHLLELRKADQAFALEMAKIAQAGDALEVQDRADARDMQKTVHSSTPDVISYVVMALFAIEVVLSHFYPILPANHDSAAQASNTLNLAVVTVLGFWLGGSLASRWKDQTISRELAKK